MALSLLHQRLGVQGKRVREAKVFATVFRDWASRCQVLRDRRVQTVQNARAAAQYRRSSIRRALQAWAVATEGAQQLSRARGLRDIAFRLWQGRARDKRAIASTVSARMKLKTGGWTNEVCIMAPCKSVISCPWCDFSPAVLLKAFADGRRCMWPQAGRFVCV